MEVINPFLTKIKFEEQYCQSELFSIVADIDPIVEGHYMIYSNKCIPSIADGNFVKAKELIETNFLQKARVPYAYFERGRASFCTSMQGVKHGHGHLVPQFTDKMESIFSYGSIEKYESLEKAYENVTKNGQYLIWCNIGEECYLINGVDEIPKRAIRNTILEHTKEQDDNA